MTSTILGNLSALGLLYDGIGIFILGVPSVILKDHNLQTNVQTYIGWNKHLLIYMLENRQDIAFGSLLLATGFIFQFLAVAQIRITNYILLCSWISLLVFPCFYIFRWRASIIRKKYIEITIAIAREQNLSPQRIEEIIKEIKH